MWEWNVNANFNDDHFWRLALGFKWKCAQNVFQEFYFDCFLCVHVATVHDDFFFRTWYFLSILFDFRMSFRTAFKEVDLHYFFSILRIGQWFTFAIMRGTKKMGKHFLLRHYFSLSNSPVASWFRSVTESVICLKRYLNQPSNKKIKRSQFPPTFLCILLIHASTHMCGCKWRKKNVCWLYRIG